MAGKPTKSLDPQCQQCRKIVGRALREMEAAREALHRLSTTLTVLTSYACRRAADQEDAADGENKAES